VPSDLQLRMLIVELFWAHDFHVQVQPFSAEEDAED
jgi:hypothetical protein